ncbi:MAG: hypothetical protein HGA85_07205 [Nanoarchaeota archaeon]|nr:hypothetical protein [Nanoarchaeota archaeon]
MANKIYSLLLGQKITGITGIFKLYRLKALSCMKLTSKGYEINTEILFNLIKDKRKITEIYVPLGRRMHGKSKMNILKEGTNHIKLLCSIFLWKIKRR